MKKTILSTLFLLAGFLAQAQNEITIEGKVTNVKDGHVVNLFRNDGDVGINIAKDTIEGGKFYFKVKPEAELDNMSICIRSNNFPMGAREVYATPGSVIQVNGDSIYICTWKVQSDVKEQKEFDEYLYAAEDGWKKMMQTQAEISRLIRTLPLATTDEEKKAVRAKRTELENLRGNIQTEISIKEIVLMKEKPVSPIWMDKLYGLSLNVKYNPECLFVEDAKALYERMSDADKQSVQGKMIAANLFPLVTVKIGDDMADAELYDLEGKVHHLAELKGKYILLDFWSSGCGPCVMAIPEMGELQQKYADKLAVVSLSSDTEKRWREASAKHQMTWMNWSDKQQTGGLYAKYGVRGIPHYVLISPEGKIEDSWSGYGEGLLLLKCAPYMFPKPVMSIDRRKGRILVKYPEYKTNNTENTLLIKHVECTLEATVLRFKATYIPNYWIRISALSSLVTPDGKEYKALKAEGITFDKEFFMPESGETEFSLTFEPLPMDATSFTFREGKGESDWQIVDVKLVK